MAAQAHYLFTIFSSSCVGYDCMPDASLNGGRGSEGLLKGALAHRKLKEEQKTIWYFSYPLIQIPIEASVQFVYRNGTQVFDSLILS